MKVLIVHHQMALYGGAELVVVRLAHYLQKHGHKVTVLAASTAPHTDYEGLDIVTPPREVQWHLWDGGLSSLQELFRVFMSLRKLCNEYADSFDVINTHNFPTIWTAPRRKRRIIWMCNEVPDLWHRGRVPMYINQLLNVGRLADRVIVHSKNPAAVVADENCARRFRHRYGFSPEVIPYGIDGEFFAQKADVERHKKFCVIQPSMISPSKGQLETLEAIAGADVKVVLAGYAEPSGPYMRQLAGYAAAHRMDVTFTDHVDREELRALYKMAHVAVFPGKGQGSWLGPFEALSAGIPVIVSPNLSCSAIIAEQGIGTVTSDIASVFRAVQSDYPRYQQQALRGKEFVLRNLTWDKFGARMMELMEK